MKNKVSAVISLLAVLGTGMAIGSMRAGADTAFDFDVNNDGSVDIIDMVCLKNYLLGGEKEPAEEKIIDDYYLRNFRRTAFREFANRNAVINTYDELCRVLDECEDSNFASDKKDITDNYNEAYFEENSLVMSGVELYTYDNNYYCSYARVSGDTLEMQLNIVEPAYGEISFMEVDLIMLEYKKSDFSGDKCEVERMVQREEICVDKPVIYLYPEEKTDVNVKLDFSGELFCTYPKYPEDTGWNVTAMPDGTLFDENGLEYSYLYWEGIADREFDMSEGFVVKGEDTAEFLREKLSYMGLTPKEYNEFIVYWLPKMEGNNYNFIKFQGKEYTDNALLDITPKPDSILRVFMTYKPLDEYTEMPEQVLDTFDRKGFTVVEWGGSEY